MASGDQGDALGASGSRNCSWHLNGGSGLKEGWTERADRVGRWWQTGRGGGGGKGAWTGTSRPGNTRNQCETPWCEPPRLREAAGKHRSSAQKQPQQPKSPSAAGFVKLCEAGFVKLCEAEEGTGLLHRNNFIGFLHISSYQRVHWSTQTRQVGTGGWLSDSRSIGWLGDWVCDWLCDWVCDVTGSTRVNNFYMELDCDVSRRERCISAKHLAC
eukprot:363955-Chlamydomonas_euryale.AAC.5